MTRGIHALLLRAMKAAKGKGHALVAAAAHRKSLFEQGLRRRNGRGAFAIQQIRDRGKDHRSDDPTRKSQRKSSAQ